MFCYGWCVWRQVMCPSCFPSLRCKIWVRLLNWIQKETKLHVQLLVCIPLQLNAPQRDRVGLDDSCVSANDQVAWATWSPKETCNFCHVRANEDMDDKPLVRPASRKEWWRRFSSFGSSKTTFNCTSEEKRRTSSMAGSHCYTGTKCVKGLAWASRGYLDFGQKGSRWSPNATSSASCLRSATWGTLIWHIVTCPPHNSRRERLTWIFLGIFVTSINTLWRHARSAIP